MEIVELSPSSGLISSFSTLFLINSNSVLNLKNVHAFNLFK